MRLLTICLIAFAFGFVGSMPLTGPIAVMTFARCVRQKFGEALRVGLGAAVAEGIYAGIAFFAYTSLLARRSVLVPVSRGATAALLAGLGVYFLFWQPKHTQDSRDNKAGTALLGFSISALNPTLLLTWSAAVALLDSRGLEEDSLAYAVPFGSCAAAGVASWFATFVSLLRKHGGKIPMNVLTWAVRVMGLVLMGIAVFSVASIWRR